MPKSHYSSALFSIFALAMGIGVGFPGAPASAAGTVLHAFQGGTDGQVPQAALIIDDAGNLYGTASGGGANYGGIIFKLAPDGTETVLYSFGAGNDGSDPVDGLTKDSAGNFYGTTQYGGRDFWGTIFRLAPDGTETVIHTFIGSDGAWPEGGLIEDGSGNLYGTTSSGGVNCSGFGCGVVFKLASDGTETTLYAFEGLRDGSTPQAGLLIDSAGNLYGTTRLGGEIGAHGCGIIAGCGTVFRLAPDGTERVLHAFAAGSDGTEPVAGLTEDSQGNFYGTTEYGGGSGCGGSGCGTVFRLAPDGTETVLYSFKGGSDGSNPSAGVVIDKSGNLYGTTTYGGRPSCGKSRGFDGCGTVFKLTPNGTETKLIAFSGETGKYPNAALLLKNGRLYGTASGGGAQGLGTAFWVKK